MQGTHVRITGPNGIGKTTLLEDLASCTLEGSTVNKSAVMGYYRQDFSLLDFDDTVHRTLLRASDGKHSEQDIRKTAAQFLLEGDVVKQKISSLSEGQKGLLSFACLVLQEPAILVVDEPTNHINFR
jgi:ATP-binding cassette subfamily F protein 3